MKGWRKGGDYLVRNGRDPPVDLDDLLNRASCAFCARGGTCGGGVCSGEISVLRIQEKNQV